MSLTTCHLKCEPMRQCSKYICWQIQYSNELESSVCHNVPPLLLHDTWSSFKVMDRSEVTNFSKCCCRTGFYHFSKGTIRKKNLRLIWSGLMGFVTFDTGLQSLCSETGTDFSSGLHYLSVSLKCQKVFIYPVLNINLAEFTFSQTVYFTYQFPRNCALIKYCLLIPHAVSEMI